MKVQKYTFNPFATNCFVVHSDGEAVIVDGSAYGDDDVALLSDYVEKNSLTVRHLLLTHAHIDHILGCARISEVFDLPWRLNAGDKPLLAHAGDQSRMFGIEMDDSEIRTESVDEGDTIRFGGVTLETVLTPGHSPGSVSFISREHKSVLSGDVLFYESIGRTDLWQGSMPVLMRSIYDKLLPLGDDFHVLCGHGPDTSIGYEREHNPFLQEEIA